MKTVTSLKGKPGRQSLEKGLSRIFQSKGSITLLFETKVQSQQD